MASQAFLPLLTQDNRILGVVPIASQMFDGSETSYTVNSVSRPLRTVFINQSARYSNVQPTARFIVGFSVSRADEVTGAYTGYSPTFIFLQDVMPFYEWSALGSSTPTQQDGLGAVFHMLLGGASVLVAGPAPSSAPSMTTPDTLGWNATAPIANGPACAFFDFNWVRLFSAMHTLDPADYPSLVVQSQPAGNLLKAYVLSTPDPNGLTGPLYNTVRIMKVSAPSLIADDYVFTFAISNSAGLISTAQLTLTVTI